MYTSFCIFTVFYFHNLYIIKCIQCTINEMNLKKWKLDTSQSSKTYSTVKESRTAYVNHLTTTNELSTIENGKMTMSTAIRSGYLFRLSNFFSDDDTV